MERVLDGLEPASVFQYFEDLTRIPHGSGNMQAISNYCVDFAKKHGLEYYQDSAWNVIIIKEASKGYESDQTLMLQGHLDMVCEKNEDNPIDMEKEPLQLKIEDDWIMANATTLGGDDGIAVAYALSILADSTLEHPRLEVVLTTEEEIGMLGAAALDTSHLKARYMLNIDSEEEGYLLTSCAGGNRSIAHMPIEKEEVEGLVCQVMVKGLKGGHSGVEIDKGRANANRILGRALKALEPFDMQVITMNGGLKDNAIPREAFAKVCLQPSKLTEAMNIIASLKEDIKNEFRETEDQIHVDLIVETVQKEIALNKASTKKVVSYLYLVMDGISTMSFDIAGLVESSLNLGVMLTHDDHIAFHHAVRSSKQSIKKLITSQLKLFIELFGGYLEVNGDYPEWEYRKDSGLRELCLSKYKELAGKEPEICAVHAGVECGLFASKMGDIDMISIGPDMKDIHTPDERLSISSSRRVYEFILLILRDFKDFCK